MGGYCDDGATGNPLRETKLVGSRYRDYFYDADGNCTSVALQGGGTTRTYTWGYNNELLQITYSGGGTNSFTYDGSGRRVSKVDSAGSFSYVYDGDRIIADGQAVYTRAGSSRLLSERRGGVSQWHHSDGLTSSRTLTNSSQTTTDTFRYDVWGDIAERTGTTPTPHQFVGALGYEREADSGLYFIGTRYYDPSVGRFISQDPAQAGVNWYLYAANNPVSAFDRDGLIWDTLLDIVGLVVDVYDLVTEPSWGAAGALGLDLVLTVVPFVPAGAGWVRRGGKLKNLLKRIPDDAISPADLERMRKGKPPIGPDGHPVELHHPGQRPEPPFYEMSRTDHRLGENYKKNHPDYDKPSKIDREKFRKERERYWKERAKEIEVKRRTR